MPRSRIAAAALVLGLALAGPALTQETAEPGPGEAVREPVQLPPVGAPQGDLQAQGAEQAQQSRQTVQQAVQGATAIPANAQPLVGQRVLGENGEEIGEVENILIDARGRPTHVILETDGLLGLGGRRVALPYDQIDVLQNALSVGMSHDQLAALPEYEGAPKLPGQEGAD